MDDSPMVGIGENMRWLFNPRSVAVIGASDNPEKLGFHVMKSITQGKFDGRIMPVNPGSPEIMGLRSSPSVIDCEGEIDLAIVVLPAHIVPGTFRECAEKGVRGIVLITAGFKEIDNPSGTDLQDEIAEIANMAGIPVIGPNTFGMINFHANLNASFTPEFSRIKKGKVCLVSQSGGISHLLGFMAMGLDVGFSKIIGLGNRLNVDFAHMIDYLVDDGDTEVILLFMMFASANMEAVEGLRDLLRDWNQKTPVIGCISSPPGIWGKQVQVLEESGALVNFPTPERAARAMAALWKYKMMRDGNNQF